MTILTKDAILEKIKNKKIAISPFNKNNLGPASYDLTLDNKFRLFNLNLKTLTVDEKTDYKNISTPYTTNSLTLKPGEFALGITKETIKLPNNICGWLSGRSRFARLGIGIHVTANFVQPGINNKQILEIKNLSNTPIKLKAGTKIMQIIFETTQGKATSYKGKFAKQTSL